MNRLAAQLKWLIGSRLIVVTSGVMLHFLLQLAVETDLSLRYLYPLAASIYATSLLYLLLIKLLRDNLTLQAYIQFFGDLLHITALVYLTGGISSPFSMLYLVVISVASAILRRRAGMNVAQIAWILYAGLVLGLYYGWLPDHDAVGSSRPVSEVLLVYNLFSHLLGFAGVAWLTSLLARNITRAEEELVAATTSLEELEVMHRDVIESIASGIVTTDLDGKVVSINRAGREILAREEFALIGAPIFETGLLSAEMWERLSSASHLRGRVRDEREILRGAEALWVGYSVSELRNAEDQRRGFIVIYQDLTEWRKLQEEFQLKDRMAAVGELAAGIAHEIGNPLAAISGSVQLLSKSNPSAGSRTRLLEIILQESRRLDRTIKGFLRFARPRERSTVRFDIARLLQENITLLGNSEEITPKHLIEIDLDPPAASVYGDPDQISQIFWNLTRNSIRAMPKGGRLAISGRLRGASYVIKFTDTGRGMTEKEKANLFHPFQSFFDSGTGIGMAIVYRIVEEHGGRISVDSSPEVGTTVEVTLPVMRAEALTPAEASTA